MRGITLRAIKVLLAVFLCSAAATAQPTSLVVDFDDGSLEGWNWDAVTFELEAADSALRILYHRTEASWEWHNFHFILPQRVDVRTAPSIALRARTNIDTELTLKPTYTDGSSDWLPIDLLGDDRWHVVEFQLVNYPAGELERIYFYLDGGTTTPRSGTVWIDDLLIGEAALLPHVTDLQVLDQGPDGIRLVWSCDRPERVVHYNVYRGQVSGFGAAADNRLASVTKTEYVDTAVEPNRTYFYRVAAIDSAGHEGPLSAEVGAHTFGTGFTPSVSIKAANSWTVGLYEKFEVEAEIRNVVYTNPYDPEQIDVRAEFVSPSGRLWRVPGFYDNYAGRNAWKVRFAPNETGTWRFRLLVTNQGQSASSEEATFTATTSPHHGWIRPSPVNPHYFVHDDGTPFYGISFYYPWSVSNGSSGLARFEQYGGNIFGYWNIMYGNEGRIIESLVSGLGRYDQAKCGRIDQIIEWAEARGLIVMLAIWPHDLLSNTVWAHQWHNNPYKGVCDVNDFYSSEEAWRYQEKQYRYLIARWGYSRSLGIWEIVNEVNGTDGWVSVHQREATEWVARVHRFFKEHDPYGHPTTASMSGGHYWADGYERVDVPNVHLYETGWPPAYPGDPIRSSLHIYHEIAARLYRDFAKPAIMGEAGYTDTYGRFEVPSPEYTQVYHNALWASWSGGLAAAPFWWAFNYGPIATDEVLEQLRAFAAVVQGYPYGYRNLKHAEISVEECDAFGMVADSSAFGWIRHRQGKFLDRHRLRLSGLIDTTYVVRWYDTWRGVQVALTYNRVTNGVLEVLLPRLSPRRADVAFIAEVAQEGTTPYGIEMWASPEELVAAPGQESQVVAVIVDSLGRICSKARMPVEFVLHGPGALEGPSPQTPENGVVTVVYRPDSTTGVATIVARAVDLKPDTVEIVVRAFTLIDDFEDYPSETALRGVWNPRSGTSTEVRLAVGGTSGGSACMTIEYAIGGGNPPYAGVTRGLNPPPAPPRFLSFWLDPDGSNRTLSVMLFERSGRYWRYDVSLSGAEPTTVRAPLASFRPSSAADSIDWAEANELGFLVFPGSGGPGSGQILLDDIRFLYRATPTAVATTWEPGLPETFQIVGVYPNPFNGGTQLELAVPSGQRVRVLIYDARGRLVETLFDGTLPGGFRRLAWQPVGMPSGVYLIVAEGRRTRASQKCVLLK